MWSVWSRCGIFESGRKCHEEFPTILAWMNFAPAKDRYPWCSNPFCEWFGNGFWVPKHLLTGYLVFGALGYNSPKKESGKRGFMEFQKNHRYEVHWPQKYWRCGEGTQITLILDDLSISCPHIVLLIVHLAIVLVCISTYSLWYMFFAVDVTL